MSSPLCRALCWAAVGFFNIESTRASTIETLELGPYEVIRPVSAIVLDSLGQKLAVLPKSAMNGDGLSNSNPLHALHSAEKSAMAETSFTEGGPITIQFDLGSDYNISELWLWQYNSAGELDRGMKDVEIVFKDEQGVEIGTKISTGLQIGLGGPLPATYFCPMAVCIRFVELRILDNFGDSQLVGLSDIALAGRLKTTSVPEATAVSLTALAMLAVADSFRRRRAR